MKKGLSYDDISIIPAIKSNILSRKECNVFYNDHLPLFTAPMSNVVNLKNYMEFDDFKINVIIPRNININDRLRLCNKYFCAFSLEEIKTYYKFINNLPNFKYVLLDIANGHMKAIFTELKKFNDTVITMAGNIANPETYLKYEAAGINYVRVGIGGGAVCTTASNTGCYYPYATLISEIKKIKTEHNCKCKIIADGGIKNYSDIIKALALGADYVMCGRIFAEMITLGRKYKFLNIPINYKIASWLFKLNLPIKCSYYGMSTKKAQKEFNKTILKTAEGKEVNLKIKYTIPQWIENFKDYLRSAMSYTNCKDLEAFKNNCKLIQLPNNLPYNK